MEQSKVAYQSIPNNELQRRLFQNISGSDGVFLLIGGALCYLVAITAGSLGALFMIVLFAALFYRGKHGYGRMYREVWIDTKGWYIDNVLKGVLFEAQEDLSTRRKMRRYLNNRHRALPFAMAQLKAVIDGVKESYGLLQQLDRPYDHLFILASGGNFAYQDHGTETRNVNLLAEVTNSSILQHSDMKVGTSYLRITGPFNRYELSSNLRTKIDPIIRSPELFELDADTKAFAEWMRQNIDQLRTAITRMRGTKNWQLIVITIKRTSVTRRRKKVGSKKKAVSFTSKQLSRQPIIELGRTVVQDLRNASSLGLEDVHVLGLAELAEVYRVGWDTFGIDAYYKDKSEGLIPKNDEEIDAFRRTFGHEPDFDIRLDSYLQAFPRKIVRVFKEYDCIQYDQNFVSTVRITSFPSSIRVDQFRNLQYALSQEGWIRRAMVGQAVSGRTETNQELVSQSFTMNLQAARNKNKIVQDPALRRRRAQHEQSAEILSQHSIAQLFNYFWTHVAQNEEDSQRATRRMIGILRSSGFDAKAVRRSALQVDASIAGMLGINRF
jgi:hypothetical protein